MSNIFAVLNEDFSSAKKETKGPGKPDKSEQRRSVPKGAKPAEAGVASTGAPSQRGPRVDAREKGRGRGGYAGRGGRGGYHGENSDGVRRNFDRKQGERSRTAPGEARKHGAVGEVDPTQFHGSVEEFAQQDAAVVAEVNGDIVGDEIMDITPMPTDPEDALMSYEEYVASKAVPEDDINRQTREVIVEAEGFRTAKPLKKEEEPLFPDAAKEEDKEESAEKKKEKKNKKNKISLDEFVGERPAPTFAAARGGRGGFEGSRGGRGGRGGFEGSRGRGAPRGGRGGFGGERPARGGRGGFGAAPQRGPNVNIEDQSAFPALSPK